MRHDVDMAELILKAGVALVPDRPSPRVTRPSAARMEVLDAALIGWKIWDAAADGAPSPAAAFWPRWPASAGRGHDQRRRILFWPARAEPVHHHHKYLIVTRDSLRPVGHRRQCHYHLDQVGALEVVFNPGRVRSSKSRAPTTSTRLMGDHSATQERRGAGRAVHPQRKPRPRARSAIG